ncbi:phosphatase PAP2 family protein [Streptomyces sp. SID8381]|uniref:phosphatase PAP2 family protein n=1 Tax=unclassified Streptomyces TaxID=2593676 RepID=UPI00036A0B97|nr:phosphatase PAP2 family protein [Streptomyces sp. Amel2xE9]MYX27654.1 phosphatase PAP2 family protein [Streptomyces sp. SID8381]
MEASVETAGLRHGSADRRTGERAAERTVERAGASRIGERTGEQAAPSRGSARTPRPRGAERLPRPGTGVRRRTKAAAVRLLDPKEAVALPFVALVAVLAVSRPAAVTHPDSRAALALSGALVAVWWGLAARLPTWHAPRPHRCRQVRDLIAVLSCLAVYPSLRWAVPLVHPGHCDHLLAAADRWLFAGHDPVPVLDRLVDPVTTAVMALAYACEWAPLLALGGFLWVRGRDREWSDLLLGLVIVQCLGYAGYLSLPAVGPWHGLAGRFTVPLGDVLGIRRYYLAHSTGVDAFPSLHVATIVLIALFAWRDCRGLFWLTSPLLVVIPASTLYLRWHYVTDLVAGAAVAVLARACAPRVNRAWDAAHRAVPPPRRSRTGRRRARDRRRTIGPVAPGPRAPRRTADPCRERPRPGPR